MESPSNFENTFKFTPFVDSLIQSFYSMDFIFRLFGSKFEGFNPIEDYDSGKAKYDNYSLMRAVEGFTVYDK